MGGCGGVGVLDEIKAISAQLSWNWGWDELGNISSLDSKGGWG